MTITTDQAAKTLGELSNWSLSNLQIQKILYLAHMFHMGRYDGEPLVGETFQAWDYGPVLPNLYKKIRFFGRHPVQDVFFATNLLESGTEFETLKDAVENLPNTRPGALINFTHREGGAWSKNYIPGAKSIIIPNTDILEEYQNL